MEMRSSRGTASIPNGLDFRMRGRIMMLSNAIHTAPENSTAGIDHKGREGDATAMHVLCGVGYGLFHALREAPGEVGCHHAQVLLLRAWNLILSASFNQTTPPMMTASQNAWVSVSGWSSKTLPKAAAPTEPMPAHTA